MMLEDFVAESSGVGMEIDFGGVALPALPLAAVAQSVQAEVLWAAVVPALQWDVAQVAAVVAA